MLQYVLTSIQASIINILFKFSSLFILPDQLKFCVHVDQNFDKFIELWDCKQFMPHIIEANI